MEVNTTEIFAIVSLVVVFIGATMIDNILKKANVETNIRGKVNFITLLFVAIITTLSGYILFFGD